MCLSVTLDNCLEIVRDAANLSERLLVFTKQWRLQPRTLQTVFGADKHRNTAILPAKLSYLFHWRRTIIWYFPVPFSWNKLKNGYKYITFNVYKRKINLYVLKRDTRSRWISHREGGGEWVCTFIYIYKHRYIWTFQIPFSKFILYSTGNTANIL